MREAAHLIGVKRAIPDARGNWTPVPAYEGWRPSEPSTLRGHLYAIASAFVAAGLLTLIEGGF